MKNDDSAFYSVVYQDIYDPYPLSTDLPSSGNEVPFKQLSGDEAIEKSYMESNCQSSIWAKRGSKASFILTSITIMKSMVGVGILGIPNVMKNFGVILTIVIMMIVYSLGMTASRVLLKCKNLSKKSNYSTIGYYIFRHSWIIYTVNLIITLSNITTCLSELIIFGDASQLLIKFYKGDDYEVPFYLSRTFLLCILGLVLTPLLIVKSIEKLRFVSLTAILSISTFTGLAFYNFFTKEGTPEGFSLLIPQTFNFKNAMSALPTLLLAYNWQFNLFPIFKGMENPTDIKMTYAMFTGYSMASFLYLCVGVLGYATYGNDIQTNYLKSIKAQEVGSLLYVILNITFVVSTTLTLPVLFFGGRNNFIQIYKQLTSEKKTVQEVKSYKQFLDETNSKRQEKLIEIKLKKKSQKLRFYILTLSLFLLLMCGAIFLDNLALVFNIKGAVFCNSIQFVLPSLFYIKLVEKVKKFRFKSKQKQYFYYGIKILFGMSWVFLITCVICGTMAAGH
ncbi:unnamed protein product [Paramecium pentaurelia]|uniref:Amino acid transporter transmembrane domain-containing protein n=1 Tax=Paramecium pentaurelia TaxID=43138 RepID=A0A8S1V2A5_9CILI|nr:unnamed protein product [Paramecium pentaurelia]